MNMIFPYSIFNLVMWLLLLLPSLTLSASDKALPEPALIPLPLNITQCIENITQVPTDLEELRFVSTCVFIIAHAFVSGNFSNTQNITLKLEAEAILKTVVGIFPTALDEANTALAPQPLKINLFRDAVDFNAGNEIIRHFFDIIHYPEDANDPKDVMGDGGASLEFVQIAAQLYRLIEHSMDAVGSLDILNVTNTMDISWERSEDGFVITSLGVSVEAIPSFFPRKMTAARNRTDKHSRFDNKPITVNLTTDIVQFLTSHYYGLQKVQIQLMMFVENPFVEYTSAVIRTPVFSLLIKDHRKKGYRQRRFKQGAVPAPVLIQGLSRACEFSLPMEPMSTDEAKLISVSISQRNKNLSQLVQPGSGNQSSGPAGSEEKLVPLHLILPFDVNIDVEVTSTFPVFYALISKLTAPKWSDFCRNDALIFQINSTNGSSFSFNTGMPKNESRLLPEDDFAHYFVAFYAKDPSLNDSTILDIEVKFTRLSCLFLDEGQRIWSEAGCTVINGSTRNELNCSCNRANRVFAGTEFGVPASLQDTVDSVVFSFDAIEDTWVIAITVYVLFGLFMIGMVITYFMDANEHPGIYLMTDLEGDPNFSYYLITVVTGNKIFAGTTANVAVQFYGENGRSPAYVLREGAVSSALKRGGVDTYLVSSERHLGTIEKIRVWHDNSGFSPEWYCRKIIVKDINRDVEWFYFIDSWLQITGVESSADITQSRSSPDLVHNFKHRFEKNFVDQLDNSHLWLSVFRHPTASRFTRCERLSCAFAMLSMYLLANKLGEGDDLLDPESDVHYGYKSFLMAFALTFFELPIGFVLVMLFRRTAQQNVPTLVIWKNQENHRIIEPKSNRKSVFVPHTSDIRHGGGLSRPASTQPSNVTLPVSLVSTDIAKFEHWVEQEHGKGRADLFKHVEGKKEKEKEHETMIGWGRINMINKIRSDKPRSFVYAGEHTPEEMEALLDNEIKEYLAEKQRQNVKKKQSRVGHDMDIQVQDDDDDTEQLQDKVYKQRVEAEEAVPRPHPQGEQRRDEHVGSLLEFETCEIPANREQNHLSWQFLYFDWILTYSIILTCIILTVRDSWYFGYYRSWDWLFRVGISFLMSVFIVQPINIFLSALFFTFFCQNIEGWSMEDEERFQILIKDDEDDLDEYRTPLELNVIKVEQRHPPLTDLEIFEIKMAQRRWDRVSHAGVLLVFFLLLLIPFTVIVYSGHDEHDFQFVTNLKGAMSGAEIDTKDGGLWLFFNTSFLDGIYTDELYSGQRLAISPLEQVRLSDQVNFLIGVPRIRQLRAKARPCAASAFGSFNCHNEYRSLDEETGTFNEFWKPVSNLSERVNPESNDIWKYRGYEGDTGFIRSPSTIGRKAIYGGGGYVAELGKRKSQTRSIVKYIQDTWVDGGTRALILEFSIYNPNLDRFLSVVAVMERGPAGNVDASIRYTPLILRTSDDFEVTWAEISWVILIIVWITVTLYTLYNFMFPSEIHLYKDYGIWLDVTTLILYAVSLGLSLKRYFVMQETVQNIHKMQINQYVCLREVAFWTKIQDVGYAVTWFVCFLKIWRLIMYYEGRILLTSMAVGFASNLILGYYFLYFLILFAFACTGRVLFGSRLDGFSSLENGIEFLIGESLEIDIYSQLDKAQTILGPIFGCLFGISITFVLLHIMIAILNQSMKDARVVGEEKFRNWGIGESMIHQLLDWKTENKRRSRITSVSEIQPGRLEIIWQRTIEIFEAALQNHQVQRNLMLKHHVNMFLQSSPGVSMIRKRALTVEKDEKRECALDDVRVDATEFFKLKLGVDMDEEELREYDDVNRTLVSLRCSKFGRFVKQLEHKVNPPVNLKEWGSDEEDEKE